MTTLFRQSSLDYYLTPEAPCPYIDGKLERKAFTFLSGEEAVSINNALSKRGFRRSQNISYWPACESCEACQPLRLRAMDFTPTKTQKRILSRNQHIDRIIRPAKATKQQFSLMRRYLDHRHSNGGMSDMTMLDYAEMVEQTTVNTKLVEYYIDRDTENEELIATALTDVLDDGLSMVYSFFNPELAKFSLGSWMIMDHVQLAQSLGLPYIYLGFYIADSPKMAYKAKYAPAEILGPNGWTEFEANP